MKSHFDFSGRAGWLLKTEPGAYSFADLLRDGRTVWEGVSNALACKHLRAMQKGDAVLIYHSGKEKAVVGTATVTRADPEGGLVEIAAGKALRRAVPLREIKEDEGLAASGWGLVRMGRLSVVPTTEGQWKGVMRLAEGEGGS